MRLFLSSQDFGPYAQEAFELAGTNKKAAFIKNAQDDKAPEIRNFYTPEKKKMFELAGFEFEEVDLRHYFNKPDELAEKLAGFGSVWCGGGNTFVLRRAMSISGFDDLIKKLLAEDKILYGGWSAGACVTANSLHGIEYGDRPQPDIVPENYPVKETIWEGLGLVPFMIVPHYQTDWFGDQADKSIEYLGRHDIDVRLLRDGQVIVVDNGRERFLD